MKLRSWVATAAALLALSSLGSALAQQPPAAPPPEAPATPAPPPLPPVSPEKLALARQLVVLSGMARSIEPMVPQLQEQIPVVVTRTRPELSKEIGPVLTALEPEFAKKTDEMIDNAARIYAQHIGDEDLKGIVAFFQSQAGKQYVVQQPYMLDELVVKMQAWTQETSAYMMKRVQTEMGKKGIKF